MFIAAPLAAKALPIARAIADALVLAALVIVVMLSPRWDTIILILLGLAATAASFLVNGEWSPVSTIVLRRGGNILAFSGVFERGGCGSLRRADPAAHGGPRPSRNSDSLTPTIEASASSPSQRSSANSDSVRGCPAPSSTTAIDRRNANSWCRRRSPSSRCRNRR
jgi:hypothetical protein